MNTISKNIKRFRQKKGWSQREVAKQLNISVPAFSKIENGVTDVNLKRLNQIALLLETSVADLMSKDLDNPQNNHALHIKQLRAKLTKKEEEVIDLQKRVIELYETVRFNRQKAL